MIGTVAIQYHSVEEIFAFGERRPEPTPFIRLQAGSSYARASWPPSTNPPSTPPPGSPPATTAPITTMSRSRFTGRRRCWSSSSSRSAKSWDWFAKPTQESMQSAHVSLGVLLTAVIVARLVWRLIPGPPDVVDRSGLDQARVEGACTICSTAAGGAGRARLRVPLGAGPSGRASSGCSGFRPLMGAIDKPTRAHFCTTFTKRSAGRSSSSPRCTPWRALYHHYVVKDRVLQRMLPLATPRRR